MPDERIPERTREQDVPKPGLQMRLSAQGGDPGPEMAHQQSKVTNPCAPTIEATSFNRSDTPRPERS